MGGLPWLRGRTVRSSTHCPQYGEMLTQYESTGIIGDVHGEHQSCAVVIDQRKRRDVAINVTVHYDVEMLCEYQCRT